MKKIIATFCLFCFGTVSYAQNYDYNEKILKREHSFCEKCSISNEVIITNKRNIICQGNSFKISFHNNFKSECAHAGDLINFDIRDAIYTQEGTLLIPANSKIVGTITRIEKQIRPNKNARVYFNFQCLILPNQSTIVMNAKPATKDSNLKEGPWMTAGKIVLYSVGLGCIGAGAGVGFAFIPSPAKIAVGLGVGIPVGVTIGLASALLSPGLKYHAKCGEVIDIILCEHLSLPKICQ